MQDQLQMQMQEQLAKIRQDMRDQVLESQRNMMNQLSQLLTKGIEKEKSSVINTGKDNKEPIYPLGFISTNVQTCPQDLPIIRTQQYQDDTSAPVDYPIGSGFNSRGNPTTPVVPDLDEIEKVKMELPKQLEDRYRWLEEKFKAMENVDFYCRIDAKDLSLVPDLVLPPKFKVLEFEKYNGTSCLEAHITIFYRRITEYVNNDQLVIHCF
ncbi:hypothetical protein PVK06_002149 [Gossypium arboreum]|uniref:Uncharacterized protein n=1 Tax=Gossypium arboreum TaxID=29729 RepID=A0ABR0R2W4_GOSAR|nr:hypothetical protein PVK06_002149 [Gossypium arboreum]